MKILLITYYYKHKNAMASVRPIKLAKYFSKLGHEVTVLTSNQIDTWTKSYVTPQKDENITEIYAPQVRRWAFIQNYLLKRKQKGLAKITNRSQNQTKEHRATQKKSLKSKVKSYLSWLFYFTIAKQEDVCMFKGLKKEFKKSANKQFDVVIATYPTNGAFKMGAWLKKKGFAKKLIADFRDPLYNPGFRDRKVESKFDKKCLNNIVKSADKLVCVSQGILDGIVDEYKKFTKPITVITNGFDLDDVKSSNTSVNFDSEKVNFVYAGTLYHGKRCVDMLANVLQDLIESGKIKKDSFAFHYAGSDYDELVSQLSCYGLESSAVSHGFVSREESISLQKNASALLLLTWNESNYKGVIPGKLFEYMSVNVPIIALITGDVSGSEVSTIIRKTNAGVAVEEMVEEDKLELKKYVEKLFNKEITEKSKVALYSYENISKKYINFIEGEKTW